MGTHIKRYPPYKRLKIVNEFMRGSGTAQEIADKYGISRRTLFNWCRDFYSDYAAFIEFYKFIMGDLSANGHRRAAEYLRDNAIDILSDVAGSPPPSEELFFDDVVPTIADISDIGNDSISAQLDVYRILSEYENK